MELQGSSFIIRPHRWGDEESLARYANNPNVSRFLSDIFPCPYTLEDAKRFIAIREKDEDPRTHFAIVRGDGVIGGVGFTPFEGNARLTAEIGYWLGEPFWGQGIATEALKLVSALAFEQYGLIRLQARVLEGNAASMRVLEKAGYSLEARMARSCVKDGRIFDVFQYVLLN
ncbi:MAG: GNAT family N-acetyltransferase [FCB group bacterium]|jgi:RimJ/RimL family protein N-acetyltransferase|nr:GNAT family N-acetyltransferase [FCB group bacterium]